MRAAIELIDDLEDGFFAFRWRYVRGEKHADAQVSLGAQLFRDQGVRGLLHAVVQESVRIVPTKDETGPHGLPQIVMHALDRTRIHHPKHLELCAVAHAGELLECRLGFCRQAIQLPDHQLDDVVGEALGVNACAGPRPIARSP